MELAELAEKVDKIKPVIEPVVRRRLREFSLMRDRGNEEWFSELCFCILTANSSAEAGIRAQESIRKGFLTLSREELAERLKSTGYRFYNVRAGYIVEARRFAGIKDIVTSFPSAFEAREWLVRNVKGIGYKEASHFLRNVGYFDVAILDKHILRILHNHGIAEMPKSMSRVRYLQIEQRFSGLARHCGMKPGELDLYLWYMATGKVLK